MDIKKLIKETMKNHSKVFYVNDRLPKTSMSFYIVHKNRLLNITEEIINIAGFPEDKKQSVWALKSGMNGFNVLYEVFLKLKEQGYIKGDYQKMNLQPARI